VLSKLPQAKLIRGLQQLLGELDIGVLTAPKEGCCGSLDLHLGDEAATLRAVRQQRGCHSSATNPN
jgi:Fe-S oxidoreductase